MPPDIFKWLWVGWLLAFGVIEFVAIRNGTPNDTFSEFAWWLLGSGNADREWFRWLARGLVGVLLLWLIPHFFTKWSWFK